MSNVFELTNVYKTYKNDGKEFEALKDVSLEVREGEIFGIIGMSGAGKSTLVRTLNRLEEVTSGTVKFYEKDLASLKARELREVRHSISMIFQGFNLVNQRTVLSNVEQPLKIAGVSRKERREKALQMLEIVGLSDKKDVFPARLSGGQKQRVAIARAIVNRPRILLLDEPLGALDLKMRKEMQIELKEMQRELGITFVYVTHDQEEALTMSDTIIVMKDGIIQQIGTPIDIYNEPKNAYVADFIGESNIVAGTMKKDREVTLSSGITFDCVDPLFPEFTEGIANLVDVVIRPEDFYVAEEAEGRINGVVESLIFKGVHYEMIVKSDDGIEWLVQNVDPFKVGSRVGLYVDPDDIQIMRRSELSPDFGSFGIKHPEAEESAEAKEAKANSIGENVVEEADVKPSEEDEEKAEVETAE